MPFNTAQVINLGKAPTASDIILKFIRDSIADGSLDEGEPIRQDDVARLFNVSKIPVREALKTSGGRKVWWISTGTRARSSPASRSRRSPDLRGSGRSWNPMPSGFSIPHMTEETFEKALGYCDAFAKETDVARWSELNWRFHSCLYEDAERPFLVTTIRSVNDRLERYLRVQLTLSHGKQTADREHRQILEACRERDEEKAAGLLYAHIMSACRSLVEHLPAKKVPLSVIPSIAGTVRRRRSSRWPRRRRAAVSALATATGDIRYRRHQARTRRVPEGGQPAAVRVQQGHHRCAPASSPRRSIPRQGCRFPL